MQLIDWRKAPDAAGSEAAVGGAGVADTVGGGVGGGVAAATAAAIVLCNEVAKVSNDASTTVP